MKLYGRGIAAVNYPTGMNLGGDPTQALVHATTVGNFVITLSSVDLGQGLKTVLAQIGAEALGVPFETVRVDTGDTDTGPHCMGTFASRATHRAGNAIMRAADEAKRALLEVAADEMEASPDDLETDGEGNVRVIGSPGSTMTVQDVALAAHFKHGKTISGRGMYMKPKSEVVPETGEMDPDSTEAHACTVADVEVDTETGFVRVLRLASAYEIGCAINPGARPGSDPRRRLDGHVARPVRDDGAVLPGDRLCAGGLLDVPDAGALGSAGDRGGGPGDALLERPIRHEGRGRDDRQPADPGDRKRGDGRDRRPDLRPAHHAREGAAGPGIQGGRVVLKVFSLIKRREDLSLDEFREWVFERHAPMGKQLPGLREYHVSVVEQDDPDLPYHAVTELYFDDEDAFKEAFASDAGRAAGDDVARHASGRVRLLTREERVI